MIEVYYAEDDEIIGKSVKEYLEQPNCTPEKENAIVAALQYFKMIG